MERILVTCGGFIGSHLARCLHSQGHFVRVVDIKFDDYIQEKYYRERLQLDLRVEDHLTYFLSDVVDHLDLRAINGSL
jgi:nucleoside-diphosphate-sugar epimerase